MMLIDQGFAGLSRLAAFIAPSRPPEPVPQRERTIPPPDEPGVPPKGSAWFESSHELLSGLQVVEDPAGWRLVPRGAPGQSLKS